MNLILLLDELTLSPSVSGVIICKTFVKHKGSAKFKNFGRISSADCLSYRLIKKFSFVALSPKNMGYKNEIFFYYTHDTEVEKKQPLQ